MAQALPAWTLILMGIIDIALALSLAVIVYRAAPRRPMNRWLALLLVVEAASQAIGFIGATTSLPRQRTIIVLHQLAAIALPYLYLVFLSTLETPLVRFLRPVWVRWSLLALGASELGLRLLNEAMFLVYATDPAPDFYPGPAMLLAYMLMGVVSFFGLAVMISNFRRSPAASVVRVRARAFLIAFASRDVLFGVPLVVPVLLNDPSLLGGYTSVGAVGSVPFFATAVFVLFVGYGILRSQLFDIDVKIRWTISKGVLATFYLAAFLIPTQLAQSYLNTRYNWVFGGAGAGLLLLALTPLQRLADRVGKAAMPGARPLNEMGHPERLSLYEEQVRVAWEDGSLSKKERRMLDAARERLGLAAEDAAVLEGRVVAESYVAPKRPDETVSGGM